jgi:uncharacterized membrane protein YccF (DUF307 family)
MKILGNILWLIFGGFFIFLEYLCLGLILCITVIGIPWGLQCFKLAILALLPFGRSVTTNVQSGGCLSTVMNVIWLLCGGIWICLSHLMFGLLLCITIIGIPFGTQHFKMAGLALTPFGKSIN